MQTQLPVCLTVSLQVLQTLKQSHGCRLHILQLADGSAGFVWDAPKCIFEKTRPLLEYACETKLKRRCLWFVASTTSC